MIKSAYSNERIAGSTLLCLLVIVAISAFSKKDEEINVDKIITLAERQYSMAINANNEPLKFARSVNESGLTVYSKAADWTSGFFAGNLWQLYRFTKKDQWKKYAQKWTVSLAEQQYNATTHDLGFMVNDSYGLGYELTRDDSYKNVIIQASKSLSSRYHPKVGAIKSWDNKIWSYPVIVDNLMNLEMLFWATKVTGDSSYYKIAVQHADTDLKYRFRKDNSSYHVLDFDLSTGKLLAKKTHQGFADSSCWSRGQAWAIYGYTTLYRETNNPKYLQQAIGAADYFLVQTARVKDHIPYWDFQDTAIPNAPRDASAAAIAASGLLELSKYDKQHKERFYGAAVNMLQSLSSPEYLASEGTNGYFLLKHSVGNKPKNSEVDVPLIYADYYFLEALYRYQHYN